MSKILRIDCLDQDDKVEHAGTWSDTSGATGYILDILDRHVYIRWVNHPDKNLGSHNLGIKKYSHKWVLQNVRLLEKTMNNIPTAIVPSQPARPSDQWIIWSPSGTNPKVTYSSYDSAEHESRLLAKQFTGVKFYVCKLVAVSETDCVKTTKL